MAETGSPTPVNVVVSSLILDGTYARSAVPTTIVSTKSVGAEEIQVEIGAPLCADVYTIEAVALMHNHGTYLEELESLLEISEAHVSDIYENLGTLDFANNTPSQDIVDEVTEHVKKINRVLAETVVELRYRDDGLRETLPGGELLKALAEWKIRSEQLKLEIAYFKGERHRPDVIGEDENSLCAERQEQTHWRSIGKGIWLWVRRLLQGSRY